MTATLTRAREHVVPAARPGGSFAGTGHLLRLALRRDRVVATIWVLLFVIMAAGSSSASQGVFTTHEARVEAAHTINNTPAMTALYGRVFDPASLGAVSLVKLGALGSALVALVAVFTVVRHTRAEEESGRLELIGATVVGRFATLGAALALSVGTSAVLAVLTGLALIGTGLPAAGAFAFGLAWAGAGIAFAAVGALTAQVTESARTAAGLGAAVLAAAYVLRAAGDAAGTWLSWLSPIGWAQQVRPFAGDRWWVLLHLVVFAALVSAAAFAVNARRDHGAGLLARRPGRPAASARLRSPLALAFRLQRGGLLGWSAGAGLGGLVMGTIASDVGGLLDSPQAREMIAKLGGTSGLVDAFLAAEMSIIGFVVAAYGVSAAARLRAEETAVRAEPLLATRTSRTRWTASHVIVALAGPAMIMCLVGLLGGLAHGRASGDPGQVGRVLAAALVQLPAVWVLVGITVLVFGIAPGLIMAGWAALALFLLLGQLGPIFDLPRQAMDLSPFTHTPRLPGAEFSAAPLVWLTVLAAALIAAGFAGFRRRDVG